MGGGIGTGVMRTTWSAELLNLEKIAEIKEGDIIIFDEELTPEQIEPDGVNEEYKELVMGVDLKRRIIKTMSNTQLGSSIHVYEISSDGKLTFKMGSDYFIYRRLKK